jgi:hypothetical protein
MDPSTKTPAELLGQELERALASAPLFVSKPLRKFEAALNLWIGSVEARLAMQQKIPSPEVVRVLTAAPQCICPDGAQSQLCPVHRAALICRQACDDV